MLTPQLDRWLLDFLAEDLGTGDITSLCFPATGVRRGWFVARQAGVVAGLPFIARLFELQGIGQWTALVSEGQQVEANQRLAYVDGPGSQLLQLERVALNLLQRLSGIATVTRQLVDMVAGTGVRLTDTRKTTPGLRWFEKYAVRVGGGYNHRWGLYDAVMLKDNHIKLAGSIAKAVAQVRQTLGHVHKIEVETESLDQVKEALAAGADIIMLDNMAPAQVAQAVQLVGGRAITEASGGINASNIVAYAQTGVEYISLGVLTHSAKAMDIGFDLDEPKPEKHRL